jgi:pimeloyl-ACP methyl ester carboxylesterase
MHALSGLLLNIPSKTGGLCAYVTGQGRPLLLVHTVNACASAAEVRTVFERMGQHRTVYAIDLPGYGNSERSDRLYTPRLMTDAILDLAAYIRTQHPEQAIDALAASLSCEFLARAAVEQPTTFRAFSCHGLNQARALLLATLAHFEFIPARNTPGFSQNVRRHSQALVFGSSPGHP